MADFLEEAVQLYLDGMMPLPLWPNGSKAPRVQSWTNLQHERPELEALETLFAVEHDGLGVLTGHVSGELEMLELEGRAVAEGVLNALQQAMADAGLADLWQAVSTGWVELTPSGGIHYHYRVAGPAARNTKLAWRPSTPAELAEKPEEPRKVLIETRGQGGFTVLAPSAGRSHPTGAAWRRLVGGPATMPILTPEQRDALFAVAHTLDQSPPVAEPSTSGREFGPTGGDGSLRPGDDFNERGDWGFLKDASWTPTRRFGRDRVGWVRPGKDARAGISATTGGAADGVDRLYVFSTSTEFASETPYTRFAAYALVCHGGDYAAAAKQLAVEGYGVSTSPVGGNLAGLYLVPDPVADQAAQPMAPQAPPAVAPVVFDGNLAIAEPLATITPLPSYGPTEDGLARAFVAQYSSDVRYCPQRGQWLAWDGSRWTWDEGERHYESVKALARRLPDNDVWKTFKKRALSAAGIAGIVRLARTDPAVTVHIDALDAHPWELNTPGGIIDMRTGLLAVPDPSRLHTRSTAVAPDYTMASPHWDRFLADTFGGRADLVSFVQRVIGLAAVGQVLEQVLPFAIGPGANGKSTLFEVVMRVLGRGERGYAITAPSEMLMVRRHSEHPAELAQLAGARMVICSEIDDGQRFAEARVKQLTGADSVNARFMRGNPFTFTPSHTLVLVGNHEPAATVGGPAFWRRIVKIPFDHVVPPHQRDVHLPDKLDAEAPAILAWIARGAAAYAATGLGTPEVVRAATAAYEADQDTVGRFVAECCHLAPGGGGVVQIKASALRSAYERWCADGGDSPVSAKQLGAALRDRFGVGLHKSTGGQRFYQGIAMLTADGDDDQPDDGRGEGWWEK